MDDFLERYPFGTFQVIERHPRPEDSIYGYITYEYQEDKDEWVPIIHKEEKNMKRYELDVEDAMDEVRREGFIITTRKSSSRKTEGETRYLVHIVKKSYPRFAISRYGTDKEDTIRQAISAVWRRKKEWKK